VATIGERTGAQPPGGGRTLFVRNATGLARELTAFDAFNLVSAPAIGAVYYIGARLYRRHQGMRFTQTFAEIPPE